MVLWPTALFAQEKFSDSLNQSTVLIRKNFDDTASNVYYQPKWGGAQAFVYDMVDKFVFPLLIAASILVVILWLYNIMFSGKDEIEKWFQYIVYGVLGIIVIQSAKFITSTYLGILNSVVPSDKVLWGTTSFAQSAYEVYNQLLMPFISLFMYAVIGTLFVILLVHVIRFITSSEEDVAAKAKAIMISNVVGIMVILLAKTMVEAIYGKQEEVLKTAGDIGDVGSWILAWADFSIVFSIVNYILWFLWLIILILIIVQTYQLLFNPTSDELIKKTKTNLLYILIGLAIIAGAYVIVNFVIIQ